MRGRGWFGWRSGWGRGMGSRAQELFRQNRIKVIVNVLGSDPEKVVLDYIGGTLEVGNDVCDH